MDALTFRDLQEIELCTLCRRVRSIRQDRNPRISIATGTELNNRSPGYFGGMMSGQTEWSNQKINTHKKPRKSKTYRAFICMAER